MAGEPITRSMGKARIEGIIGSHDHLNSGDDSPELFENDAWSIIDRDFVDRRRVTGFSGGEWGSRAAVEMGARGGGVARHVAGGLSLAFGCHVSSSPRIIHQLTVGSPRGGEEIARSAPVQVPVWGEVYRIEPVDSEDESEVVPPHVYLARGRRTGGMSVFEGVGRTLKGRDLRRVRDAVWSQTGFDG